MTENKTPTRLLFVRHGQDLDNSRGLINGRRDTPLSEVGRTQAVRVAEQLRPEGINCVYSSPLQRATQTASIIAERIKLIEKDAKRLGLDSTDGELEQADSGLQEVNSYYFKLKADYRELDRRFKLGKDFIHDENDIPIMRTLYWTESWTTSRSR